MKLGTRRIYKILTLLLGGSCLLLGLVCVVKRFEYHLANSIQSCGPNNGSSNKQNNHRQPEDDDVDDGSGDTSLNKSYNSQLNYYEPRIKFNEQSLDNYRASLKNHQDAWQSKQSGAKQKYLLQPSDNVIECQLLLDDQDPYRHMDNTSKFQQPTQESNWSTTLFIVINSRADNFDRRQRLRETWLNKPNIIRELCSPSNSLVVPLSSTSSRGHQQKQLAFEARIERIEWVFALGHLGPANSIAIDARLRHESQFYGDLLVFDLLESYRNMTKKHLAIFNWLLEKEGDKSAQHHHHQHHRHILLKCDDDVQLDLSQMISRYVMEENVGNSGGTPTSNLLMCARFEENSPVLRKFTHQTTKWSLSRQEWPYDTFPSYCSGLAYLASLELVEKLHLIAPLVDESLQQQPLWIDDVYVTGILLASLELNNLKLVKLNPYFCYTEAQRLHRESLEPGVRCMAAELSD